MGYVVDEMSKEILKGIAKDDDPYTKWYEDCFEEGDRYKAMWGCRDDGRYSVAIAQYRECTKDDGTKSEWIVDVISQSDRPFILPSVEFAKMKPKYTPPDHFYFIANTRSAGFTLPSNNSKTPISR